MKKKRKYYGNRYSNRSKKACVEEDYKSDGQPRRQEPFKELVILIKLYIVLCELLLLK